MIQGNGFLYNMVRIIAGTLIDVGLGKMQADRVPEILANRDRRQAGATAPACGLYLLRVLYPNDLSLPAFQVDAEEEEDTA